MRRLAAGVALLALLGAGFSTAVLATPSKPKPKPKPVKHKPAPKKPAPKPGGTTTTTPAPVTFASGLYYVTPSLDHPGGTLTLLGGALKASFQLAGNTGWAINRTELVWAAGSTVHIVSPAGADKTVTVKGLYALGRPTLSPDGTKVAVQATELDPSGAQYPQFLTIYVITLADGSWKRLVAPSSNPATGNELPEWDPANAGLIAHQGIRDEPGSNDGNPCDVFPIVDATSGVVQLTIQNDGTAGGCYRPARGVLDGPRFQITFTPDGSRLLVVGQMRTYSTASGALVSDIHDKVLAALTSAGYAPDARYPGQGGGGTFPLDGTFSPDGSQIVFDGAVQKDGTYGVLLMRVNTDGSGFTILAGPLNVSPQFSNNHNYSQLNPYWLP